MKTLITAAIITVIALATSASAGSKTHGKWRVENNIDALTGEREIHMWSSATTRDSRYGQKPFMGIDCESLYFGRLDVLNGGNV